MTVLVSDPFTSTIASLSDPPWTRYNSGTIGVASGVARPSAGASVRYQSQITPLQDQFARIIWRSGNGTGGCGVVVRGGNAAGEFCYVCYTSGTDTLNFAKVSGGGFASLNSVSGLTLVNGDVIEVWARGGASTVLTAFQAGVQRLTYTDSSSPLTTGVPGVVAYCSASTDTSMNGFEGGDFNLSVNLTGIAAAVARGTVAAAVAKALSGGSLAAAAGTATFAPALALSGGSLAAAAGTATFAPALALSGRSAATAAGTLAPGTARAVTGQAVAPSPGSVSPSNSVALLGTATASAAGSIVRLVNPSLTGSALAAATGNVSAALARALTGQASPAAPGTIATAMTRALTGQASPAVAGAVAAAVAVALSGQSAALTPGTVTYGAGGVTVALTGASLTGSPGSVLAAIARALTGSAVTAAPGALRADHDRGVTGVAAGASPGSVAPLTAVALLGSGAAGSPGSVGVNRAASLTGATVGALAATLGPADVQLVLSGSFIVAAPGDVVPGIPVTADLAGQAATFTAGIVVASVTVAPTRTPTFSMAGLPASANPQSQVTAGSGAFVAGPYPGAALGYFAWADPATREVTNIRREGSTGLLFGLVLAVGGSAGQRFWFRDRWYLRPGVPVTLMNGGDFWMQFAGGARPGARVYASKFDGAAISGESPDSDPTGWYVVTATGPGGVAIISTTTKVSA